MKRGGEFNQPRIEIDPSSEKPSDLEVAMFFIGHLQNPCGVEVAPGQRATLRDFYVREATRSLESIRDPEARALLERELKSKV